MTQRIKSYFDTSHELRQLSHKASQLLELQRLYEKIAPPSLALSSRVMQLEQKILMVQADNGAVAAKLRQLSPRLSQLFRDNGQEVTAIQVRVQVTFLPTIPTTSAPTMGIAGRQRLIDLADKLSDSPLKSALQRLARAPGSKR